MHCPLYKKACNVLALQMCLISHLCLTDASAAVHACAFWAKLRQITAWHRFVHLLFGTGGGRPGDVFYKVNIKRKALVYESLCWGLM